MRRRILTTFVVLAVVIFISHQLIINRAHTTGDLVINELMVTNAATSTDSAVDSLDWIEIYNRDSQPINLMGWSLTDDPQKPQKWTFPSIDLASGQYQVVFASGTENQPIDGEGSLHANFKLNRSGEFLGLYNASEGRMVDLLSPSFPEQHPSVSYGRVEQDQRFHYLMHPTPGKRNAEIAAE